MQIHTLFLFLINGVSEEGEHMSECCIVLKASLIERLAGYGLVLNLTLQGGKIKSFNLDVKRINYSCNKKL